MKKHDPVDFPYVILGNSTAAVRAVEGIREVDPKGPILLVASEPYHPYSRPLISYWLAGEIGEDRMDLRPRDFYGKNGVTAWLGVTVTEVDPATRTVRTDRGDIIRFGKLLAATGGKPVVPPIRGRSARGIFNFTTRDDAKALSSWLDQKKARKAVVVGGGLIGIKAAEALYARGLEVTVVELGDRVLPQILAGRGADLVHQALDHNGVELKCNNTVLEIFSHDRRVTGVLLSEGSRKACDVLVVAVGVVPNIGMFPKGSVKADRGLLVDGSCETSVKGVFAAGDAAQGMDAVNGVSRPITIFPNAGCQGRVAGVNMAGGHAAVHPLFAMNSLEVFGIPVISAGATADPRPGDEVLEKADENAGTYRRVVLRGARVAGALFVGAIDRAGIFTGLIRERVDVSEIKPLLLEEQFGLVSLPRRYRKHVVTGEGIEV